MERVRGIEPLLTAWKAEVLPLNYTRTTASVYTALNKKMVGTTRFEHATPWSQTRCSTKLSYVPKLTRHFLATKINISCSF
jgi:hypothetical protein